MSEKPKTALQSNWTVIISPGQLDYEFWQKPVSKSHRQARLAHLKHESLQRVESYGTPDAFAKEVAKAAYRTALVVYKSAHTGTKKQ